MGLQDSAVNVKHKLLSIPSAIDRYITEKIEPKELVAVTSKSRVYVPDEKGQVFIAGQGYSTQYILERKTTKTEIRTPEKEAAYASPVPIASKYAIKRALGGLYTTAKETAHLVKKVITPPKYIPSSKPSVTIPGAPQAFIKTYVDPAKKIPHIISTALADTKKAIKEDPVGTTAELAGSLVFFEGVGRAARASKLFKPKKKLAGIKSITALEDVALTSGKTTILKGTGKYTLQVESTPVRSLWKPHIPEPPVRIIDKIPVKVKSTTIIDKSGFESYITSAIAKKDTFHVLKGKPKPSGPPKITTLELSKLQGGGTFTYGTAGIHTDLRIFPAYKTKAGVIVPRQVGTKQKLQSVVRFQEKKFSLVDTKYIKISAYAGASHTSYSVPPIYTFHSQRYYEGLKITGSISKKPFVVGLETGESATRGIFSKHKIPSERVGLFESEYPLLEYKPSVKTKPKPSKPIYSKSDIQKMQALYQDPSQPRTILVHKPTTPFRLSMDDMKILSSDARTITAVESVEQYLAYPPSVRIPTAPIAASATLSLDRIKPSLDTMHLSSLKYTPAQKDAQASKISSVSATMQETKTLPTTELMPVQKTTPYTITTLRTSQMQIHLPIQDTTIIQDIKEKQKFTPMKLTPLYIPPTSPPPERPVRIPIPRRKPTATPQKPTLREKAVYGYKVSFLTDTGSFPSKYPAFTSKTEAKQFAGLVSLKSRKITGFELKEKKTGKERLRKRLPSWLKLSPKFRASGTRYTERNRQRFTT